jgi:hypothetical protein
MQSERVERKLLSRATIRHWLGLGLGLRSPNAWTTAILIDELDTGGFNSGVFPWLELDDQFVAVTQAHRGSTPEFSALGNQSPAAPIFSLNLMPEDSGPLRPRAWSNREIGFVSQKRRARLSALRLCRLAALLAELPKKPAAGPARAAWTSKSNHWRSQRTRKARYCCRAFLH